MSKIAPQQIPENLIDAFTLNGKMAFREEYINEIETNIGRVYTKELVEDDLKKIDDLLKAPFNTFQWLIESFEKYPVTGEDVLIIGSQKPFYEAISLKYGGHPVTIELNPIKNEHPGLRTLTINEFEKSNQLYNRAISISTYEHTGLGRYGDDLDPEGDFKAMAFLRTKMRPGGLLYLSVPIGKDTLVWNAHRIYGPIRLPLLLQGWELVESYGFPFIGEINDWYQPVFVLRNS